MTAFIWEKKLWIFVFSKSMPVRAVQRLLSLVKIRIFWFSWNFMSEVERGRAFYFFLDQNFFFIFFKNPHHPPPHSNHPPAQPDKYPEPSSPPLQSKPHKNPSDHN